MKHTTTLYIELEVELEVEFSPSTLDVFYLRNGDPGYPGELAEWEFLKVGKPILDVAELVQTKMEDSKFYDEVLSQVIEELAEPELEEEDIF